MNALYTGYDDMMELLVLHGANINAQQKNGTTALMLAAEQVRHSTCKQFSVLNNCTDWACV